MTHGEILSTWPYCLHFRLHLYHKSLSSENGRKISLVILFLHLSHSLLWPIILFLIKQHSGCHEIKIVFFFTRRFWPILKEHWYSHHANIKAIGSENQDKALITCHKFCDCVYNIYMCVYTACGHEKSGLCLYNHVTYTPWSVWSTDVWYASRVAASSAKLVAWGTSAKY